MRFTAAPTADFCAELHALGLGEAASGEVAMLEGVTWLDDVPDPLQAPEVAAKGGRLFLAKVV